MSNAKVLVTDDEAGLRLVLANILKSEGYNVLQAEDGATAIEIVKKERPNMMLLDMRLPDMDGLEILAEVKKIAPQMPVIMVSGFGDVESAVVAMKKGAFDYVSKPFKVDEVKTLVRKALGSQVLSKEGILSKETPAATTAPSATSQAEAPPSPAPAQKKSKIPLLAAAAVFSLIVGGGVLWKTIGKSSIMASDMAFDIPYANPTALAFDGSKLWISDWVTQSIYHHKLDNNLTAENIYYIQDSHPTGLTWDGANLWSCNSWERKIYKHNMDDQLSVLIEYPSPGQEPTGLYWDGIHLWVGDIRGAKIFKLKVSEEGLTIVGQYDSPGPKPVGFFSDGESFWIADSETNLIYKVRRDESLSVQGIYSAPQYENGQNRISGMTWDGKHIWTTTEGSKKVFRHSLKNLNELKF